jgi:hypothetical protein
LADTARSLQSCTDMGGVRVVQLAPKSKEACSP